MTIRMFQYFPHDADMGIIGYGDTVDEAFIAAGESVFAMMYDIKNIKPLRMVSFEFVEHDLEYALVTWLNTLLGEARAQSLMFAQFKLEREADTWRGRAYGEPWNNELATGTEVKGATLTMLRVWQTDDGWGAKCVVDV